MRSSERRDGLAVAGFHVVAGGAKSARAARAAAFACLTCLAWTGRAGAQQPVSSFAVERLSLSAPGGGWLVMEDLSMHGGFGGAVALTSGYAQNPLRAQAGGSSLDLVQQQAFADLGLAVTYDRWRLYTNFQAPLLIKGQSGTLDGYAYTAPSVDLGTNPDTMSDIRIGFDGRLFGEANGPLRLGFGAQAFLPSGKNCYEDEYNHLRCDYDTDGKFHAMLRALAAGDLGALTYAAHVGVHIRQVDDSPVPGGPRGSELLFGAAAGPRFALNDRGLSAVVGAEVFGETAFSGFFGKTTTGLEAMLSGRLETKTHDAGILGLKLAGGAGLNPDFGAPEWRVVAAVELQAFPSPRSHESNSQPATTTPAPPSPPPSPRPPAEPQPTAASPASPSQP